MGDDDWHRGAKPRRAGRRVGRATEYSRLVYLWLFISEASVAVALA
jgi:hypothetical protein